METKGCNNPDFQTREFNCDEKGNHKNSGCIYFWSRANINKTLRVNCKIRGRIPYEWCTTFCKDKKLPY